MTRLIPALVLFALLGRTASPADGPSPPSEFASRRQAIRHDLKGVVVVFGRSEASEDLLRTGFFQEPDFYYLTGWQEPDAVLILTKDDEEIFLPARNEVFERYYGHKTSAGDADARSITGFQKILPKSEFEREFFRLLGDGKTVSVIGGAPQSNLVKGLLALRPAVAVQDATKQIDAFRMIKSTREIALTQHAADISVDAQKAAFSFVQPGKYEYQVAAQMEERWGERGCEQPAYAPIVASGPNAVVLHYSSNKRRMDAGDLVVIDAAAECSYYTADITRTLPVNGHFTDRQREIYNVVLAAQEAAIAAVKPGAVIGRKDTKGSLMQIAYDYMNSHGRDRSGETLGKYVVHGLSHHIGLEVHDPGDIMQPLKPGMVISIEPGIYIRDENIGVRIEDMVLVTPDGHRVLTGALPKAADEIERLMVRQSSKSNRGSNSTRPSNAQ